MLDMGHHPGTTTPTAKGGVDLGADLFKVMPRMVHQFELVAGVTNTEDMGKVLAGGFAVEAQAEKTVLLIGSEKKRVRGGRFYRWGLYGLIFGRENKTIGSHCDTSRSGMAHR